MVFSPQVATARLVGGLGSSRRGVRGPGEKALQPGWWGPEFLFGDKAPPSCPLTEGRVLGFGDPGDVRAVSSIEQGRCSWGVNARSAWTHPPHPQEQAL